MQNPGYVLIWIVLLLFPILAAWKKRWLACGIYLAGCVLFFISTWRELNGWGDLAAIATLLVVVGPIYILGTLVSLISFLRRKNK